ncbi:MAG: heme-binding protein, partial [Arenicellales bacterium]
MNKLFFRILTISGLLLMVPAKALAAEGTVTFEMLKPETALTAAQAALERCREEGFQATVAVV